MSPLLLLLDAPIDLVAEHAAKIVLLILLVAASLALVWMCTGWPVAGRVLKEFGRARERLKALFSAKIK